MMENIFYLSKRYLNFSHDLFDDAEKRLDQKAKVNLKNYDIAD